MKRYLKWGKSYLEGGNMRKLMLLVAILMVLGVFTGCQQTGLSEAEVRNIVQDEVTRQLALGQARDTIETEVTRQLQNIDVLMVSSLLIADEEGRVVATLSSFNGEGSLSLRNANGEALISLGSLYEGGHLTIWNGSGETVVNMGAYIDDSGYLLIFDEKDQLTFQAP